jgi:hypothetical protein
MDIVVPRGGSKMATDFLKVKISLEKYAQE